MLALLTLPPGLCSLAPCADSSDEVYFYARRELGGAWYWRLFGWDADDLMSDCHVGGVAHTVPDPHGEPPAVGVVALLYSFGALCVLHTTLWGMLAGGSDRNRKQMVHLYPFKD